MTGSEIFSLILKPSIWIPSEPDDRPHTAGPKHTEEMPAIGKGCKREPFNLKDKEMDGLSAACLLVSFQRPAVRRKRRQDSR